MARDSEKVTIAFTVVNHVDGAVVFVGYDLISVPRNQRVESRRDKKW